MKIAIYTHSIAPSIDGVCRRFTGMLWELAKQNHDILLFTLEEKPEDLPPSVKYVTIMSSIFPAYPGKKVAIPSPESLFRIWSALKNFQPEILHCTADGVSSLFVLNCMIMNIPIVASFHTDLIDLLRAHGANWFQKLCVNSKEVIDSLLFDSCATTSKSFKNKLIKRGIDCQHVIKTSVNGEKFSPKKRDEKLRSEMLFGDTSGFLCVYVGRLSKEKQIDVLISAIQDIPDTYLAIVGDGPSAATYARKHGKANRIYCKPRFLSHEELAQVYASSDVHVSASEFETLGNTVLEAFACGIPVVVPRSQGFCDTVAHAHNGFLFTPKSADDCRRCIDSLRTRASLRNAMGQAGLETVASCSVAGVVHDLLDWYKLGIQRHTDRFKRPLLLASNTLLLVLTAPLTLFLCSIYRLIITIMNTMSYVPATEK